MLLPQLAHVYSHLDEPYVLSFCSQESQVLPVIEVCLSASHFGGPAWKNKCIFRASQVLLHSDLCHSQLALMLGARIRTRQAAIFYLYKDGPYQDVDWPRLDHRSNAFSADAVLLKAESCMRLNALLSASEALSSFNPAVHGNVSTLEKLQLEQIILGRASVAMLEGNFSSAYSILSQLPHTEERVALRLARVLCELGQSTEAEDVLRLSRPLEHQSMPLETTVANVRLYHCMDALRRSVYDRHLGQATRDMYQDLLKRPDLVTIPGQYDYFTILFGLAILDRLDGRLDSARERWDETLVVCKSYPIGGYADMIVVYSIAELEMKRGNMLDSEYFTAKAKALFTSTGRQHHFLGLGSIWPDILGQWYESQGYQRIVPAMYKEALR